MYKSMRRLSGDVPEKKKICSINKRQAVSSACNFCDSLTELEGKQQKEKQHTRALGDVVTDTAFEYKTDHLHVVAVGVCLLFVCAEANGIPEPLQVSLPASQSPPEFPPLKL